MAEAKTEQIGYAIVGLGHIVQAAVLPAFANAQNARLVALVSGDEDKREALAECYGVDAYSYDEYEQVLEREDVDAVFIGLPNHLHCDYTVRAAQAGVHVLCEKPMAVTEAECQKMIDACEERGVKLMIAYRLHFEPANLEAIEIVRSGELGEPRIFSSVFSQNVEEGDIRLSPIEKGGGSVYDIGIYCINAARYLFGDEPIEVFATSHSPSDDPRFRECDASTSVTMRFASGQLASFTTSFDAAAANAYRVVGTEAELVVEPAYDYTGHLSYRVVEGSQTRRAHTFESHDQFGPELVYFADCILENREPEPDGKEGLADIRIIRAIYESARSGRPIEVEPVEITSRPGPHQKIVRPGVEQPDLVKVSSPTK